MKRNRRRIIVGREDKSALNIIMPLLTAEPEQKADKETVTSLSGAIEISHLSFRYGPDDPEILKDLNLTIPARQYVAIVGKTGCGKSTLMRILLGFETPTRGAVFYDRKDTRHLDMRSVRRLIGTVMQDGTLFGGSIYENISKRKTSCVFSSDNPSFIMITYILLYFSCRTGSAFD